MFPPAGHYAVHRALGSGAGLWALGSGLWALGGGVVRWAPGEHGFFVGGRTRFRLAHPYFGAIAPVHAQRPHNHGSGRRQRGAPKTSPPQPQARSPQRPPRTTLNHDAAAPHSPCPAHRQGRTDTVEPWCKKLNG
ncbi:hypothetical protein NicSoilE8_07460 [Arthrobacter sp. NicSoilE8]|nr:hypothetical protein NicSoilE8_07460 [Arthrobacter sp. NicSoilE8]